MKAKPSVFFPFLIIQLVASAGCSKKVGGLLMLKDLSNSQEQMAAQISAADERFEKLVFAIHEGRLSTENSKRSIRKAFGEPILREAQTINGSEFEVWLYRYAKQFFGSDKVYLYFDDAGRLDRWQYVKAKEAEDVQVRQETESEIPSP